MLSQLKQCNSLFWAMLALPLLVLMWASGSSASNSMLLRTAANNCTVTLVNMHVQDNGSFGYNIEMNCPGGLSNWVLTWDIGDVTLNGNPSGATVTIDNGVATMLGTEPWSKDFTAEQPSRSFYVTGSGTVNQNPTFEVNGVPIVDSGGGNNSDSTPGSGGADAIIPMEDSAHINRCSVAFRYDNAWRSGADSPGGIVTNIAIFNNTGSAINDWEIEFDWPAAQGATIENSDEGYWVAGDVSLSGTTVTASAASDATADIPHNNIRSFGFVINGPTLAPNTLKPTSFTVNGEPCNPQGGQTSPGQNYGGTLPILSDPDHWGRNPQNRCQDRFFELYDAIHDPANGYTDEEGIPYHAVEELNVEAPDYGHVTTSEAFSYLLLLEAAYGRLTSDWGPLEKSWAIMEHTIIPDASQQPTWGNHTISMDAGTQVATYAPENYDGPQFYPAKLADTKTNEGVDLLYAELNAHWNGGETKSAPQYLMHWLLDVDNTYNFGGDAPGYTLGNSVYINTFQRGAQESTWETVPHPSYEDFTWGGENGFLDIFVDDSNYTPQWRYTNAPDADARALEALRLAELWAEPSAMDQLNPLISKAAKMADYVRYDMFDKYFAPIGCTEATGIASCNSGAYDDPDYSGAHNLLAWYTSWGAPLDETHTWAFVIGASDVHYGYQDPWAAWVIDNVDSWSGPGTFPGISPEGKDQWAKSYQRQMELYLWLQSDKDGTDPDGNTVPAGAFAGGVTNSWEGTYNNTAAPGPFFYGMSYNDNPVYHDPGSNTWFGFQGWSGQRYMMTLKEISDAGMPMEQAFLDAADDFANMAIEMVKIDYNGQPFALPSGIEWGDPNVSKPAGDYAGEGYGQLQDVNTDLQMNVTSYGQDVGVAASIARTLLAYSKIDGAAHADAASDKALKLMDALWTAYSVDSYGTEGIAIIERRGDYHRFFNETYIPEGQNYMLGDGSTVGNGATFNDIHWFYGDACEGVTDIDSSNPAHQTCAQYCEIYDAYDDTNGDGSPINRPPDMLYHRFWAQVDNAMALVEADDFGFSCGTNNIQVTTDMPDVEGDPSMTIGAHTAPAVCDTVEPLQAPTQINVFPNDGTTPPPVDTPLAVGLSGQSAVLSMAWVAYVTVVVLAIVGRLALRSRS